MVADRIKTLREENQMTQAELARRLSITRASVNAWEMGISAPSTQYIVELAGIFVQIGLLPNTNWLEGAVERNRMGEIIIDAKCETSVKGVFAAGDCTTVPYKQIIIATGEGAKASLSSFDYLIRTTVA